MCKISISTYLFSELSSTYVFVFVFFFLENVNDFRITTESFQYLKMQSDFDLEVTFVLK